MINGFDKNCNYFIGNLNSKEIPTIFIHGVGLDHSMWKKQINFFKNYSVIFYDLLNHGKSIKYSSKLKFEDFNIQLNQLISYLNIKKFNLVGFSLGALIAQHYTEKNYKKINKLIIISSVHERSKKQKQMVNKRYNLSLIGKNISRKTIYRWFNSDYLRKNIKTYNYFNNLIEENNNIFFLKAYKLFCKSDEYKINYKNFSMPTLIMTGENDLGSTSKMSKKINDKILKSQIQIIKNSKHMFIYEKSNLVNNKIFQFLR